MHKLLLISCSLIFSQAVLAQPLPPLEIPPHPYLSPVTNLHLDHYYSSVSNNRAPASDAVEVKRVDYGPLKAKKINRLFMTMCLNFMNDPQGEFYGFCSVPRNVYLGGVDFQFVHFDKKTWKKKNVFNLTKVNLSRLIKNDLPLNLGYFTMDHLGRAIITDEDNTVNFIGLNKDKSKPVVHQSFSLRGRIPSGTQVAQVTPDFEGRYWFMSLGESDKKTHQVKKDAYVGYFDPKTGESDVRVYFNKVIENGFAVDETGVYVLTDHEMQKLGINQAGKISTIWDESYERATKIKPGTLSVYGSGSSPTLVHDDLIVITDNADERVNLLVYKRGSEVTGQRLVCKVPVFKKNKSANENSVVGYGNSIIVQNWYNAPNFFGKVTKMEPGVVRIDIRKDRSGCNLVWENNHVAATSTIKLSTGSGYLYAPVDKGDKHYMSLLNFHTGKVDYEIYMNKGLGGRYMNAPVSFGPEDQLIQPHFSGMTVISP